MIRLLADESRVKMFISIVLILILHVIISNTKKKIKIKYIGNI